MAQRTVILVGDRFHFFAKNTDVYTRTNLHSIADAMRDGDEVVIVLGQGISINDIGMIQDELSSMTPKVSYRFDMSRVDFHLASRQETHKLLFCNRMISSPRRISELTYVSDIIFHTDNDYFRDHLSTQHIPGMALIEAARQMFLAVTEKYFMGIIYQITRPPVNRPAAWTS